MAAKKKPIKIKNYKNIQPLGEGGMGMVYKAVHPVQTDKEVVIKTILLDNFKGASRKEAEELFKKEAELMDLQCENIVNFYDIFKEGRKYYIVMEYVNGLSLEDMIIEERHLRVDEIVLIFLNMLKGLDFIHTKGLVHKDIKPANFLISTEGEVKISDFGIGG
ncbi:MAG TPA: serine/threonine-protein kinase, partial [Spirochaetota bacterium]|nr:serine/threonine-protein kinase [Spirochaetota bacterium]